MLCHRLSQQAARGHRTPLLSAGQLGWAMNADGLEQCPEPLRKPPAYDATAIAVIIRTDTLDGAHDLHLRVVHNWELSTCAGCRRYIPDER